jgi:hypothetical protein
VQRVMVKKTKVRADPVMKRIWWAAPTLEMKTTVAWGAETGNSGGASSPVSVASPAVVESKDTVAYLINEIRPRIVVDYPPQKKA